MRPTAFRSPNRSLLAGLDFTQLTEDNLVDRRRCSGGPPAMHYTELARRLKLFRCRRCQSATADEIKQAEWRIVHGKVCAVSPKDHAAWGDFVPNQDPSAGGAGQDSGRARRAGDGQPGALALPLGRRFGCVPAREPSDAGATPTRSRKRRSRSSTTSTPSTTSGDSAATGTTSRSRRDGGDVLRAPALVSLGRGAQQRNAPSLVGGPRTH